MNIPTEPVPEPSRFRRLALNRYTAIAFVAGAILATGVGALAAGGMAGWHQHMMLDGTASPAEVTSHVNHVLKHFYVEIDATDAQKAKIGPLVTAAVNDLIPMHTQLQAARQAAVQALTQPTVDRTALEAARVEHLQFADQASKRIEQVIADVGDVLTPAQRSSLMEHLQHMHGMPPT